MIKVILIILLILIVLRLFGKFVIITNFNPSRNSGEEFSRAREESKKREGQITIQKSSDNRAGDFVEYDEVKS